MAVTYLVSIDVFQDSADLVIWVQFVLLIEWLWNSDARQILDAVLHENLKHVAATARDYHTMCSIHRLSQIKIEMRQESRVFEAYL